MRENEKDSFYEKYMHFLNTLPQDVQYQELVMNYPTDRKMLEEAIQGKKQISFHYFDWKGQLRVPQE